MIGRIGFGSASLSGEGGGYGFGAISESDSIKLLRSAIERGVSLIDSAPIYGFGVAERRIGKVVKDSSLRDQVSLVSKAGVTWDKNYRVDINNSPKVVLKMLEQSLSDLETDYIDHYMIHWPDPRHDIRNALEVLARAKEQGKILKIGLSNTNSEELSRALEICEIESIQGEWNLFRNAEGLEPLPGNADNEVNFMGWGTFDKGVLTGRVTEERVFEDKKDARSWAPWWKSEDRKWKFKVVKEITDVCERNGQSLIAVALAGSLNQEQVSSALVGVRNLQQLDQLLEALENLPSGELMNSILKIVEDHLPASEERSVE